MSAAINFKEIKSASRITILPGVCADLDEKKNTFDKLDSILTMVAEQLIMSLPDDFPYQLSVVYFPQLGYLISIPKPKGSEEGENGACNEEALLAALDDFEFKFSTDENLYYKNGTMEELDRELGDLHQDISDLENAVLREVETAVLKAETSIEEITDAAAELDCILSLAQCAQEYNYVRPQMKSTGNELVIEQGRNPIQEQCVNGTFIPNDTSMKSGKIHLITGPNNSGKTVYLRQLGLIVYMAHVGSFVPATRAEIGITDRIMTRIQTHESVSVQKSTFAIDLLQINQMIKCATSKSLILIDEFGKGTLSIDGISLLSATMKYFMTFAKPMPRVLVTTHFIEIMDYQLFGSNVSNNSLLHSAATSSASSSLNSLSSSNLLEMFSMDVFVEHEGDHDQNVVYLYKLSEFKPTLPHHALYCAKKSGVSTSVVERAKKILSMMQQGIAITPLATVENKQYEEQCNKVLTAFEQLDCKNVQAVQTFLNSIKRATVAPVTINQKHDVVLEKGDSGPSKEADDELPIINDDENDWINQVDE